MNKQELIENFFTKTTALLVLLCFSSAGLLSQPADNPIRSYYGDEKGYPGWSDEIAWDNVIDMSNYSTGTNDFEKFENARDELYAQGGGVLYYPGGDYYFDVVSGPNGRGLMLKKGVVIRGEAPASDKLANAGNTSPGLGSLPTKFHFSYNNFGDGEVPDMWNCIGAVAGSGEAGQHEISHVGIAWVNLDGAYLFFGLHNDEWSASWGGSQGWFGQEDPNEGYPCFNGWCDRSPDGSHILDPWSGDGTGGNWDNGTAQLGSKRFVFGCRFDNSTVNNYGIDFSHGGEPDYYFPNRYGGRITVYGKDVFVSNNVISKPEKCFKYTMKTESGAEKTLVFDYAFSPGIEINKNMLGLFRNRCIVDSDDGYYARNVVVMDNWVYNHSNKGYEVSGNWVVIKNNTNHRNYLQEGDDVYGLGAGWELAYDGYHETNANSDNMSRAFDIGGRNLTIEDNYYTGTGSDPGNDGEGVLWQRHNEVECFSASVVNSIQGSAGEEGYIGPYDTHVMGLLIYNNDIRGVVGLFNHKSGNVAEDLSFVNNVASENRCSGGGTINDCMTSCPGTVPTAPSGLTVTRSGNQNVISWQDNASNEIGFKVERRKIGSSNYQTIAYRPRNESGGNFNYSPSGGGGGPTDLCQNQNEDYNPQKWVDYQINTNDSYDYRVIAINCSNTDDASTVWVNDGGGIIPSASVVKTNVSCKGQADGAINVSVAGGTIPYSYSWDDGSTSEDRSGLTAGTYSLTVTDANSYTDNEEVTITEPDELIISESISHETCNGCADGEIDITVDGGTTPYQYDWSDNSTVEDISGLSSGTYGVTVSDDNGCNVQKAFTVDQLSSLSISSSVNHIECYGTATGGIDVTVSNGTTPYDFNWSSGESTEDLSGKIAGVYGLTVTDANSETLVKQYTIEQDSAMKLEAVTTIESCDGCADGQIDLTVSGGSTPYTYNWSNGEVTQDINNLTSGIYYVTVTDNNSCNESESFHVGLSTELVKINFQPPGFTSPSGYLPDTGAAFGNRGNGYNYGWNMENVEYRERSSDSNGLYNTMNHMELDGDFYWEIDLPNGDYKLTIVCGDAEYSDQVNDLMVEDYSLVDTDGQDYFDKFSDVNVNVSDGRLTINTASSSENAKICYLEISEINIPVTVKEIEAENVRVYPVPASDVVHIEGFNGSVARIISDKGTDYGYLPVIDQQINIRGFPPSVYFIQLISGDQVILKKVLKQ